MKNISLYIMAGFYIIAGSNHFIHPGAYLQIMPPWAGYPYTLVAASGALEILFGFLLIPRLTRVVAAWSIIGLLILIFPANIQMMLNYMHQHKPGFWITVLRLPLQFVLIWWAFSFTRPSPIAGNK